MFIVIVFVIAGAAVGLAAGVPDVGAGLGLVIGLIASTARQEPDYSMEREKGIIDRAGVVGVAVLTMAVAVVVLALLHGL